MKLASGKRVGQSGHELTEAVFFSFILHGIVLLAAVFLFLNVTPRTYVPPFYQVKLVGLPPETAAPSQVQPAPPQEAAKPAAKAKKAPAKAHKATAKKGALPELTPSKQKTAKEEVKPAEASQEPTSAKAPSSETASSGAKTESVAVSTQQDFKFGWYLAAVRDKIGQNWRPPPDARDAKARVIFSINRSGWVGEVRLDNENSIGTFGFKQAAVRAIRSSNPFPPLPEDFSKQALEFSVDLMEE